MLGKPSLDFPNEWDSAPRLCLLFCLWMEWEICFSPLLAALAFGSNGILLLAFACCSCFWIEWEICRSSKNSCWSFLDGKITHQTTGGQVPTELMVTWSHCRLGITNKIYYLLFGRRTSTRPIGSPKLAEPAKQRRIIEKSAMTKTYFFLRWFRRGLWHCFFFVFELLQNMGNPLRKFLPSCLQSRWLFRSCLSENKKSFSEFFFSSSLKFIFKNKTVSFDATHPS